jgi:hypothetical protein
VFKNFWKRRVNEQQPPPKNPNELYEWHGELPLAASGYCSTIHRISVERCGFSANRRELLEVQQFLRERAEKYYLPQVKPRHLWNRDEQERAAILAELFQGPSHRIKFAYSRKDDPTSEKLILDAPLCFNLSGYSPDAIATTLGRHLKIHLTDFRKPEHQLPVDVNKQYYLQKNQIAEAFWLSSLMARYKSIFSGLS